ncbi:hypothetical protein Tdes44962_MAKER07095 [Teratosphaeria destructans]|uniref:Uncharacterized protein n=1 Tax=Teratosphaeria destructans TaxID=418781 RepID=A0A9W7T0C0_9PEZI|nr:hypothetical protein Tdes44962_MAKER07095 [Teratosphaeria destructans]
MIMEESHHSVWINHTPPLVDAITSGNDSGNGVDVYFRSKDGRLDWVIVDINVNLDPGEHNKHCLIRRHADPDMTRRVAEWIQLYEKKGHRPLTFDLLDVETLDKLLEAYVTRWALCIRISLRGDETPERIEQYIENEPSGSSEFL